MAIQDSFDFPVAYDPTTGSLVAGATFTVHATDDLAFATPLLVSDPVSGAAISPLVSSTAGVLPSFRVAGDPPQVIIRSGSFATLLSSRFGVLTEAGFDADEVAAAVTAAAGAQAARDEAQAAQVAAEAAQAAMDSAIAGALAAARLTGEINMLDVVGTNNGTTDHDAALTAVIGALAAEPNASGATRTIYFPRGQWTLSGAYVNSEAKRFNFKGDGPGLTIIKRPTGATGDLFTLNAKHTSVEAMTIEGGRYQGVTGDLVVVNSSYTHVRDIYFNKGGGSGLVIGKASSAIAVVLNNLHFRECAVYGIWTVGGSGSTDGMWSNLEIGNSGKYGVRLGTGSQNISNLHVWGSGLESTTEKDGIFFESGSNSLSAWQSEKNLGRGIRIESNNNVLVGGRAWGNCFGAIYLLNASYNAITGNTFHQNSVLNTGGTTSTSYGVIFNEGTGLRNNISNNLFWDNTTDLGAGSYVTAPTYPYPGRSGAIRTHAVLIAEGGTVDYNTYVGNTAQRELTRLGSTVPPYVIVGNNDLIASNDWGVIPVPTRSVSAGAVRIPAESDSIIVAVSQEITSVLGQRAGRTARIIWTNVSPQPIRDNGTTLNLNGDFSPTTNDVLSLWSDGTNWYEIGRSAN